MTDKAKRKPVADQEADFLLAFFGKSSATRLDRRASAISAGYTPRMAMWNANRLLKKFADKGFRECVEAIGVTTPALAVAFKETLETAEGKEALASLRLALANRGEQTDNKDSRGVTFEGPTMVILGATPERLDALRRGGAPRQLAKTEDHTRELLVAPNENVIDVEAVAPASTLAEKDGRKLTAADFSGRNLSEKPKGPR
jgi:hypothetical protein